jgi:hypothetical protein
LGVLVRGEEGAHMTINLAAKRSGPCR